MKTFNLYAAGALVVLVLAVLGLTHAIAQNAMLLAYGQPASGTLDANQSATYTFNAVAGDKLTISLAVTGGELAPVLSLYDPQGKLIGENTNAEKYVARLEGIVLSTPGTYQVVIRNANAQGSGQYGLIILQETASGAIYYDAKPNGREFYQLSQPLDHKDATYRIVNTQPGFDPQLVRSVIAQAFQSWANATDLTFREVTGGRSDFVIQFNHIDGPSNILGETCPPSSPCAGQINFDDQENWVMGPPQNQRDIGFLGVAAHEFGHAVGLLHSNSPNALMYYAYSPYNLKPGPDDMAGVQRLYGPNAGRSASSPTSIPGVPQDPAHPTVQGTLDNNHFTQFWDFGVEAGDTITITMRRNSGNLDAVLVLLDANNNILAYDDDGAGNRDATLRSIRLPGRGTYTVAATRYEQAQGFTAGNYTLTISYNDQPVAGQPTPFAQPGGSALNGNVNVSRGNTNQQLTDLDTTLDSPFEQSIAPGTQSRTATVSRSQSYHWVVTWCAANASTLQTNLRNISAAFSINGSAINTSAITQTAPYTSSNLTCTDWWVLLSGWSGSGVTLSSTLSLRSSVFDGNVVYAAGDYTNQYTVAIQ